MRAQYHFRMLPQGLCAWDVRRLLELSRFLTVERVPLAEIRELDEPYWCGESQGQMTCRAMVEHARLIEECDLAHPVILSSDGRVMDGMHRICKALLLGHESVEGVRFVRDPEPDHVGVAPDDLPYAD
ncbi:MAG: hypothetical protein WBV28_22070 [Terracidiphilus sp.]